MPSIPPLATISRRVHLAPRRRGLSGLVQRVAIVVLPGPRPAPALLGDPGSDTAAARDRARRALLEARREMSGVIGDGGVSDATAIVPAVMPDFERLQRFLEESERDRAALREEVGGLRAMLEHVTGQLDRLHQSVTEAAQRPPADANPPAPDHVGQPGSEPAPLAAASPTSEPEPASIAPRAEAGEEAAVPAEDAVAQEGSQEDAPPEDSGGEVAALRERVLRALRERVFAAGTVGTRIELRPPLPEPEAASVLARMNDQALVELAEEGPPAEDATSVRVTLRAPLRWEQFSSLLEAALGRPLPPNSVGWSQGVVRVSTPPLDAGPAEPRDQP